MIQLVTTVLIPLFMGQIIRNFAGFRGHTLPLNSISQCALLFVIYTTFCDTFETPETGLSAPDILASVFSVLFMQMVLMGVSYSMAQYLHQYFTAQDTVAIIFCSTHKSLTLGSLPRTERTHTYLILQAFQFCASCSTGTPI
jgi:sodium/bile acid cotransporter 7